MLKWYCLFAEMTEKKNTAEMNFRWTEFAEMI